MSEKHFPHSPNGKVGNQSSLSRDSRIDEYSLHSAAKNRNVDEVSEILLSSTVELNKIDKNGNSPLHSLLSDVCSGDHCKSKAALITELLLEAGADINLTNRKGDVPLYLAIKNEWKNSAMILLHRGANTTIKLKNGKILAQELMENMPFALADALDFAVKRVQIKDEDLLLVNFSHLLQYPKQSLGNFDPAKNNDETEFLHSLLVNSRHTNLYHHPVTELFMRLKYRKLKYTILSSIIMHIITLLFYTTYVVYLYIYVCNFDPDRKHCSEQIRASVSAFGIGNTTLKEVILEECDICEQNTSAQTMSIILAVIWLGMIGSELVVLRFRARARIFSKSVLVWLIFLILMPITLWPSVGEDYYINTWRYPIAACGVWLIWALFVEQLSKIQSLSIYLVMFVKVSIRITLLACLFFPLLVGFSFAFYVMGAENIETFYSFVTLISLTVGEPNYDDFFNKDREKSVVYETVAIILYMLFVILMCVIFVNFLLGLTISDVKELWEESKRTSKKDQIRLMFLFDRLKFHRFKIFRADEIRNNNLVYALPIKNYPTYLPDILIKELKELSTRTNCSHHSISLKEYQSRASKSSRHTEKGKGFLVQTNKAYRNFGIDDHSQILEIIRHLESQIHALTLAFKENNNNIHIDSSTI